MSETLFCDTHVSALHKEDLQMSKETYKCQKRPTNVKRDHCTHLVLHTCLSVHMRRFLYSSKMLYIYGKRDLSTSKETYKCQKRHTNVNRDLQMRKEITVHILCYTRGSLFPYVGSCVHPKRRIYGKRDLSTSKETFKCQKRPTNVKGDLRISKEIIVHILCYTHGSLYTCVGFFCHPK